MNIYDISKKSGVSIATVSRAINNSGYVSEKTRAKIMKVIEENDYSPNAFARGMSKSSMSTVGVFCSDSRDLYQASCIYHLDAQLKSRGYTVMLACTGHELKDKQETVKAMLSKNPDALIFIGSHYVEMEEENNKYLLEAAKRIPVILLNGFLEGENIFSICCEDRQATRDLTDLAFAKGAKKPVFLHRRLNYSGQKKFEGFHDACREHGSDNPLTYSVKDDLDEILNSLEDIDGLKNFDCFICADDEIALGALKFCKEHNLSVPDQVQVIGYNNSILARASDPEITTYDNKTDFLSQSAVYVLMNVLDHKDYPARTTYSGKIIERDTTRK